MPDKQRHQQEVQAFLQKHFSNQSWTFTLPEGTGNETYFAHSNGRTCFVKLGALAARVQAVATIGLTPPVLAAGSLADGTSIIVQAYIPGKIPSRRDYRLHLEQFATAITRLHLSLEVKQVLPDVSYNLYRTASMEALSRIQLKWDRYRSLVPAVARFVDASLANLEQQVQGFQGSGLVASHNDICNANWLLAADGNLYLMDLDSMSLDDPALDIGATLWWYYPPGLRKEFLAIAGYPDDPDFANRMQVRMAMHCLDILLPRPDSFDEFVPASFPDWFVDFRAILAGEDNPQGYAD